MATEQQGRDELERRISDFIFELTKKGTYEQGNYADFAWGDYMDEDYKLISAIVLSEVKLFAEAACRAQCELCSQGVPVKLSETGGVWVHYRVIGPDYDELMGLCRSARIRHILTLPPYKEG